MNSTIGFANTNTALNWPTTCVFIRYFTVALNVAQPVTLNKWNWPV